MIWWIVGAIVFVAIVVLAVVSLGTLRRLLGLRTAAEQLKNTQNDAAALQAAAAGLEEKASILKVRVDRTRAHIQALKDARKTRS